MAISLPVDHMGVAGRDNDDRRHRGLRQRTSLAKTTNRTTVDTFIALAHLDAGA